MSERPKLSQQFMLTFTALRTATNDSPRTLITFFRDKPNFQTIATELKNIADRIELASSLRKVHSQIDERFISEWKLYRYKWRREVEYIVAEPLLNINLFDDEDFTPVSFEGFRLSPGQSDFSEPDPEYETEFDPRKHNGGEAIRHLMSLAEHERDTHYDLARMDSSNDALANAWNIGMQAVEYLEGSIGLDLNLAFERWNKVPPFFIPKHVSDQHGLTEKGSLYELLNDAIRAFVAGAPAASVAMCRAALEQVLREHYLRLPVEDRLSLHDVIDIATAKYEFLNARKLHSLRMGANRILHEYGAASSMSDADEANIITFFKDLRFYIEKAPD